MKNGVGQFHWHGSTLDTPGRACTEMLYVLPGVHTEPNENGGQSVAGLSTNT